MNRISKWITLLIGSTLIAAAALGAVVVVGLTNASAQVETPNISSEIEFAVDDPEIEHWPGGRRPGGRRPGRNPEGTQFLADALGIPVEELQAAQEAARLEAAEIALEEGLITEEQVERMEALQAFKGFFDREAVTEQILGLSVEELKDAHAYGKRMPEILEELGLEPSDLGEAMKEAFNVAVQEAIDAGVINEDQAGWLQEKPSGGRSPGGFGGRTKPGQNPNIDFEALLAGQLNISVDELQEARQEAQQAGLEQALADGKITEEQLEMMEARKALSEYLDRGAIMEEVLGMSIEELKDAHADGKRLPEILQELGLEPSDLRDAMQAAFENALQQAVDDGVIDEDQAEMLKNRDFGGRKPFGPGMRPGHGGPGNPGGFDGPPPMRDQAPTGTGSNL